jgi:speckle-type POZ protein
LYWETNEDGEEEEDVMAQHLLVAADRYNLARLKLICEDKLCKYIDVGTVATILALAEQHQCHGLKKACFRFLSSPENLKVAVASESFDHLSKNCPSVMKELVAMLGTLLE